MATYKVDVISQLGKYYMAMWEANSPKKNPADNPAHDTLSDVVRRVVSEIEDRNLHEGKDAVIFRGIAFEDFSQLTREISRATY
ncbi:MAG: hypothetical protein JW797_12000 [Bradymonadales bacterium]|nr:hypothetical protein [Bradymonadales bacterium]